MEYNMKEIWKDIEGYEGIYQISNLGRVKSLIRVIKRSDGKIKTFKERILKPALNTFGYPYVNLSKQGKVKSFVVHRLVVKAFILNIGNKSDVNHINGIKTDNRVVNLEWNTRSENVQHAFDNGLNNNKGSKHTNSKLTEKEILEMRNSKLTQTELAKIYNVSQSVISNIKNRKIWNHI